MESVKRYSPYKEVKLLAEASEARRLETQAKLGRVSAENLALQQRLTAADEARAQLTKALELWATEQAIKEQPGEDVLWQVLDAAVGVLTRRAAPHAWESEAFEAGRKIIMARREGLTATASNQSAPADKGHGEPVAWRYQEYVWATGIGDYVWRDKIEREAPDLEAASIRNLTPLYAEQPAPVAAAMPERMEIPSEHAPAYVYRKGWNACLDEVARLNSEPKP